MTYQYYYQTSKNENRVGTIKARNRADAYALLRKQGIRPYRVAGDDPVRWQPWAAGAAILILVCATIGALVYAGTRPRVTSVPQGMRTQLAGDTAFIAQGVAEGWAGVFSNRLDNALALYAQPGWNVIPPDVSGLAATEEDLREPIEFAVAPRAELEQLRGIVKAMRADLAEYIREGGTIADYFRVLDERQGRERSLGEKARETYLRTPEAQRARMRRDLNVRLKGMGLAPLPQELP